MNAPVGLGILIALVTWLPSAWADDKELAASIDQAAQQLAVKDWQKAEQGIKKASTYLGESKDDNLRAQLLFYSALTQQQRAGDTGVDAAQRQAAREQAITDYESYIKLNPESASARNNLAQLYAQDPAQRKQALQLYDRAIALNDPRVDAYRLNRAALLAEMGESTQALQASRDLLKANPHNPAARSLMSNLLQKSGSTAEVADYVRQLKASGLVEASMEAAVSQIEARNQAREPILVAFAESLADPALTELPAELVESATWKRLLKRGAGADIGAGVQELAAVFDKPPEPQTLTWWRRDAYQHGEYEPKTRAAAMLELARALGDRCRRAGKGHYDCAERYYRFSIDFTGATADPEAFLSLAEILVAGGRQNELASVAKQYEQALFRGKGTAYERENKPKIFRFHLALGMMYAYLEKWSDPQWKPAGAVFQLQHALDVAADYNRGGQGERLQMPPQAAAQLSDGYAKLGQPAASAKVRVEAAEVLLAEGDRRSAAELLNTKWRESLPETVDAALLSRVDAARARAGPNQ